MPDIFPIPDKPPYAGAVAYTIKAAFGDIRFAPHTRNFFHTLVFDNCARPLWVYGVTFVPAFIEVALVVAVWELEDIIRSGLKAQAFGPRRRRGRSGRHTGIIRAGAIPLARQTWSNKGLQWALRITQPLEYLGMGILLYAAADHAFYRWGTLIEAIAPCDGSGERFGREANNANWGQLASGGSAAMNTLNYQSEGVETNGFGATLPPGRWDVVAAASLRSQGASSFQSGLRLIVTGALGLGDAESGLVTVNPNEAVDVTVSTGFFLIAGGTVTWETYGDTVPIGVFCEKAFASGSSRVVT